MKQKTSSILTDARKKSSHYGDMKNRMHKTTAIELKFLNGGK